MPDKPTSVDATVSELGPILDEELAALPSLYRDAIVLCDLRGIPRTEAATQLGVQEGTLSSRLAVGRKKLAARLTKRGITLSAVAIPATLSTAHALSVPTELSAKTIGLIADWLAGAAIPRQLTKLSEGGMTMRKTFMMGLLSTVLVVSSVVYATQATDNPLPVESPKSPVIAAKTETANQAVPDAKPGDKGVVFTGTPKLRDTIDISVHSIQEVNWDRQGDRIAIVGRPTPKANQPDRSNLPENTQVGCVFVVAISPLNPLKITNYASFYLSSQEKDKFAGFTADGKQLLAEHREYQLLSGVHKLSFLGDEGEEFGVPVRPIPGFNPTRKALGMNGRLMEKHSIDLDPAETQGYYFAADGKTFRTIGIERDPTTKKETKLHVLEIDAATGNRMKSLLTVEAGTYAMNSDGKRLAVLGQENTIEMYDVDRAAKVFSTKVPSEVKKSEAPASYASLIDYDPLRCESWMTFSPDGRKLFVSCGIGEALHFQRSNKPPIVERVVLSGGIGQSVVLNADTGDRLPALEGGECLHCIAERNAFTADGRLIALAGTRFNISKQKLTLVRSKKLGEKVGKNDNQEAEQIVIESPKQFLTVWDTQTGKVVKSWEMSPLVAFNPKRPILAVLERNDGDTRLGLWDFSAELADKK
jgi:WD40 repeat protein